MARVVRFHETGGPEVLRIEQVEVPPPGKDEVRIRVHALGLNRAEAMFRSGQYLYTPRLPSRLGYEAAGTVEAIGSNAWDVAFLAITNDVFESRKKHYVTIWLAARYASGELSMNTAYEISAVDWFSWDALPEPLFLPLEHLLTGQCYPALWDFSDRHG